MIKLAVFIQDICTRLFSTILFARCIKLISQDFCGWFIFSPPNYLLKHCIWSVHWTTFPLKMVRLVTKFGSVDFMQQQSLVKLQSQLFQAY